MKGDKGTISFGIQLQAYTYWQPEFSGTLLGFDDYVSKSSPGPLWWLSILISASRYGARRRYGVVRTSSSHCFDFVLPLKHYVVTILVLRPSCRKFYSMGTIYAWLVTEASFRSGADHEQLIPGGEGPVATAS
jgi:hypothetical protein